MTIGVSRRVEDRRGPGVVDARERVLGARGSDGVDRHPHVAVGSVLEPNRHRQSGAELAVRLALARPRADRAPRNGIRDVLRGNRIKELATDQEADIEDVEQELASDPQAGVDVAGAVEVRVVDEPLPADGRARLLEVDAHRDQQVVAEAGRDGGEAASVVERRVGVVDAARAGDHEQAIVLAVEHGADLVATADHRRGALVAERKLVEEGRGRDELDDPLDAAIAHQIPRARLLHSRDHRGSSRSFITTVMVLVPLVQAWRVGARVRRPAELSCQVGRYGPAGGLAKSPVIEPGTRAQPLGGDGQGHHARAVHRRSL